jgi:hypothetical protein
MDARGVWEGVEAAEADLFLLDRLKKDIFLWFVRVMRDSV